MRKAEFLKIFVAILVAFTMLLSVNFIKSDEANCETVYKVFSDLNENDWYYEDVTELYKHSVIPRSYSFSGDAPASRGDIVLYLYNLSKAMGKDVSFSGELPFEDVLEDSEFFAPVSWAYFSGIIEGTDTKHFGPNVQATREQFCTIAMRYLTYMGIKPKAVGDIEPFGDSLTISRFARSYAVSAKLSGIIVGDGYGNFNPFNAITRGELAKMINRILNLQSAKDGEEFVDTTDGAYTPLYVEYIKGNKLDRLPTPDGDFEAYVNETDRVGASYFDDAVFVGDSVSMSLQFYCASSKALGKATFLCAGSLSPVNAHWEVTEDSRHPIYKGEKLLIEDAVKKSGAKKVYIMLGINSLGGNFDGTVRDLTDLIWKIIEKSPDVQIIVQSVTPMTSTSPIYKPSLNNNIIYKYNEKLLEICNKYGWYYINVAEAVSDSSGYLRDDYCSDPKDMGIHFNFEADKAWTEYLKIHAPQI